MGNEASAEGAEGALAGLPDGKGGFSEADLSHLSEEERRQLVAAMAKAQSRPSEPQPPGARGPTGLSKSRTVDAFGEGPPPKPKPGRSPSSLSLLESRFRQEPKDSEQPRTGMFSSSFLSGSNPLSAVSSAVSSAKFGLFGDDEEEEAAKQASKPGPGKAPPQQGPPKGQAPPQQKPGAQPQGPGGKPAGPGPGPGSQQQGPKPGGPGPQQQGPKPGGPGPQQQGPKPGGPGPQQQGPKPGGPGPQQQGPGKPGPGGPGKPSTVQQGPAGPGKPGAQQQGPTASPGKAGPPPGKAGGALCPLCKTTELNLQAKDQPPNYSTCTQCKQQVCSLCGFSPPDSAGKEWLCLNCQMQRAMGGMEPPGPPMMKQPPKQGSAPPSPQRKEPPPGSPTKDEPGKKPPMLSKQQSIGDIGKGATPPTTPKQKTPGPGPQQQQQGPPKGPQGAQPGAPGLKRGQQPPPLQKPAQSPKGSPQPSPAKTTPKQDGGGFFGGFSLGGLTDAKAPAAESVTGKLFSGFGSSTKPQGSTAPQASESVTGKLFSGFGGLTEAAKPTAATSQASEGVSGKMFGFGSSILSSASNLITGEEPKSPQESPPGSPPDSPIDSGAGSPPGSPPDSGSESPPDTPPAYSKEPASPKPAATEGKVPAGKPTEPAKAKEPVPEVKANCPLCKVALNMGSGDAPNYSTCTECQKTVCNLCGFNPMPHLSEKEWLCLNCQTQRALSGQLGDAPPPPSPSKLPAKSQPTPPASPARTASSTPPSPAPTPPAAPAKGLTRTPSVTQAQADKSKLESVTVDAKPPVESTEVKHDETQALLDSTQVVPDASEERTPHTTPENTEGISAPPEQTVISSAPPPDSIPGDIADVKEADAEQPAAVEQNDPFAEDQKGEKDKQEQSQAVEADVVFDDAIITKTELANTEVPPESEGVDENLGEAPLSDNNVENNSSIVQLTEEQVTDSKENPDRETHQLVSNQQSQEVSPPENLAENCSAEPALPNCLQTSVENNSDDKNIPEVDEVTTSNELGVTTGSAVATSTLGLPGEPEEPTHPDTAISSKYEAINEMVSHNQCDAVTEPQSVSEYTESEERVSIEEKCLPNTEEDSTSQNKDEHKSEMHTQESQVPPAETPMLVGPTPASPTPTQLTDSELTTESDISVHASPEMVNNECLNIEKVASNTSCLESANNPIETEDCSTVVEVNNLESVPVSKTIECSISKAAVDSVVNESNVIPKKEDSIIAEKEHSVNVEKEDSVNAEKEENVNAEKEESVNAEKEESVNAEKEESVNAEKEDSGNAGKEDSVNAGKEDSVNAEKEDSVNAEKKDSVNAEKEESVNAEKEDSVNAEKEDSVNAEKEDSVNAEKEDASLKDESENVKRENSDNQNQASQLMQEEIPETETDTSPTGNISDAIEKCIEDRESEKDTQVVETPEKHKDNFDNENVMSTPEPTISEVDEDIKEKTKFPSALLAPQNTAPKKEEALPENVPLVKDISKETALETEYEGNEQIPETVQNTETLDKHTVEEKNESAENLQEVSIPSLENNKEDGKPDKDTGGTDSVSQAKSDQISLFSLVNDAKYMEKVSKETTVESDTDTLKTENKSVVEKDDSSAVSPQTLPEKGENSSLINSKTKPITDIVSTEASTEQSTTPAVSLDEKVRENALPVFERKEDIQSEKEIKSNVEQSVVIAQMNGSSSTVPHNEVFVKEQEIKPDKATDQNTDTHPDIKRESYNSDPAVEPASSHPLPLVSNQEKNLSFVEMESADTQEKKEDGPKQLKKPKELDELGENKEDSAVPAKDKELLKEPSDKNAVSQESSPTSPSDLAKLESTVLPILEAQTTPSKDELQSEGMKTRRRLEVLPMSPDLSSEEDRLEDAQEENDNAAGPKKERKKLLVPTDIQGEFLEDSSEGDSSPLFEVTKKPGEEKHLEGESPGSAEEEEFIRKQIMEMSADEDASPSDEESIIRPKRRDHEKKQQEKDSKKDTKEKSESGKTRRLLKNSSISPEDEPDRKSIISVAKIEELDKGQPLADNGAGIRHFKTIELNSVATVRQASDDGEAESLTDSPDDRSKGEGSSSLHASSFTPGTSPTSLSSLDEDSDSSSPSHIRSSGEGKQHRKAKHRQPGQMLPTIEDSSEEEELREEEELLKEQEKQKSSGKKSKKDKDEIRAQRRRERPKTPPSNLSPIEDASPTEELRQEAEMEEIRRSSCSDFSPSMESEPEGFEILPEKIAAVQKVYQLPTSVSLYSPTDEQHVDNRSQENKEKLPLKTADEAYEEIMLKAKSPTTERGELPPGKESLYGGMLIEDYAYESLVEDVHVEHEQDKISVPEKSRKLRSPDEVYEDMMQKKKEILKEQQLNEDHSVKETPKSEIKIVQSDPKRDTTSTSISGQSGKDGKPLLDAEEAYEELMKKHRTILTPGTSPTQSIPDMTQQMEVTSSEKIGDVPPRRILPIPDLRVTQCSSGEEESGEESTVDQYQDIEQVPVSVSNSTQIVTEPTSFDIEVAQKTPTALPASESVTESTSSSREIPSMEHQIAVVEPVDNFQSGVVDLSKSSASTQIDASPTPVSDVVSMHSVPVSSPLPTVPQYTPTVPSVISTAPPVPPKPVVLRRAVSQEKADIPVPPPLPPPTLPKPTVYPKKIPPQVPQRTIPVGASATVPRQPVAPSYKPHVPPPVPPKPSSIPAGLTFSHRPGETVKPPIAPKPMSSAQPHSSAYVPPRPNILPTSTVEGVLNLSPSAESKTGITSPIKSPTSPRFGKNLHDTYVVITLPSQPGSPIEGVTTQAPISSGPTSPIKQAPSHPQPQAVVQPETPPQTTRVPLAFTRITESIESQEICGPEKVVSSMSHVYEAISASQPSSVIPAVGVQVVTTEVQRTTVSVVHERTAPPPCVPRATGIPGVPENLKTQPVQTQNGNAFHPGEVVDLRTPKVDSETTMKGMDLSSSESRRQSLLSESNGRQQSAVQSSVINLSTDTSSVSLVTDSITILTCTATIAYSNGDISQASSMPLQLTTAKSFEPVSQIIYRPVDSQPEKPINLSTTVGKTHPVPVTVAPSILNNGISTTIPPRLETSVSGAVDLTTMKPVQTMVSVDGSTSEVVTAVITEDDGKPVDLTAGRRAVCCDVVYKLPFTGSCASQQPPAPLPEDRFGYRDDHYQYDRSPYGMRGLGGIKPSMSDTNLAEAGLFLYKSKNSYDYNGAMEGAVDLTSSKMSVAGEAVDYSSKATGAYTGLTIPQYSHTRITSTVGTHFGVSSVLRSSNGVVYSSVAAPVPSTYAITTQPGSIFSTSYNTLSGMHTSDTMPSLSNLQNHPLTRSHSFLSTVAVTTAGEQEDMPLNLEKGVSKDIFSEEAPAVTTVAALDYTDASLEAIAASLEALSSPMVPGDEQYQMEREFLELEKIKQQRLAEELEWERQEIQRFREQEQLLVQKELEELQVMKQQILCQQEEERQAHLMMQKETYAQQQEQLEQIQRLQEQLRMQLEEQKYRQMYPGEIQEQTHGLIIGTDKKMDSGCQTDEEDNTDKDYSAGRKKKSAKKSVDSCVQTDDEDQDEWEAPARGRRSRSRGGKYCTGDRSGVSVQALTEISVQTDSSGTLKGHTVQMDTRVDYPDSDTNSSPKRRPTPLEISQSPHLKADTATLQVAPGPPKSPKVLYSPISPCMSPSKSLEFVSYEKSLGDTSPQKLHGSDPAKVPPGSPRAPKVIQRSMSDPKPMSPTAEERAAANFQYTEGYAGKGSPGGTPSGTQKKVKRTLPNPPSEEEAANAGQTAYSTASARRRLCRSSNMARAKILQDIDRELDLVERESSKLRKKQAELDEEEKEIDAKLRYLEMGINRRKDALLKEREKRERAYLQSVAEDRDYMSDSEVSNIRETRRGGGGEDIGGLGLERPRTAPQSELDEFVPPQTKHEYGKYSQYQYPQYQQSLYQSQQPYQSQSIYSSVPSLTASQQQSYHQMLLLQQKARQQAALLSELDATKVSTNYDTSSYLGGKYGNHLDLRGLEERGGSMAGSPMSTVSADSFYADLDQHHQTPRSYLLLEDAAELAKSTSGISSTSYGIAERELAKAERLLRRTAADVGTDYLGSTSRLHSYGKTQDDEDSMEEPYELKLLKQQLKQEFRRSTGGTESLEQLAGLSHHYTPSTGVTSGGYRPFSKSDKYSISRLTLEKQAAKQLPTSMLYQKHKNTSNIGKYSIQDSRSLETEYSSYLGSSSASPRSSRLLQDEITFGLRKNIAEQQKYLGSTLGANLAGSLNLGQSLNLSPGVRSTLGEDSAYPSGSRSRPSSRPSSVYGLDLSIKRDTSSSSLRLKAEGDPSSETSAYQTPSGRTKPTSLPIVQSGRGRIPIVAQNSEEESPLSPVGQPMGMARASAGPLPPISADSRDQFGSCLSLQDPQQQHLREDSARGRSYVLMDDLQGTMSDSEALSDSLLGLNRDDPGNTHENVTDAYHLRREETDWFDKPREDGLGLDRRQIKSQHYPFPHARVKLQRDPKDRSVSGNGLGIRVVGGKEVPGSNGEIGAYVAKVLPGGAAEQTGKIVEGMQVLEWNGIPLSSKTYEEVQGLVGQQCGEAELCVRLDLNMLSDSEGSHLDLHDQTKTERPPRSPGVDPKQLAAELQKVSQQQVPGSSASSLTALDKASASGASSAVPSPGQPGSPSVSKKRHSKTSEAKIQSHPVTGDIQLQINYDKQLGNLIVHVLQARNLAPRDNNGYSDPFVKVYLLPGRSQVMVVQNASAENKRRSKHAQKSCNPEWNQTVIYKNIHLEQLRKKTLEVSVWDYDKCSSNDFLGEVLIDLSNTAQLDNVPRWLPLKEQSEGEHHRRSHSGQGRQHSPKPPAGHSPKSSSHGSQDSPKSSVIKSRSHGIFPDPGKDTQVPTIEKSHSSPSTSKPSPSEGQARSHGTPRAHAKSGAARAHPDDTTATAETAGQHRLQPTQNGRLSLRHHRHSVVGVLTLQKAPANEITDGRHLTLRKAMSEERPQLDGASRSHRSADAPVTAASLDSGLSGSAFSLLEEEGEANVVDSAIFQVPRFGKIPNGTDVVKSLHGDTEGKTQVMGEIKIALKKEMKTEGEQLVLEILQCRNITYKFKTPDHLPDLYVKLYVVNVATQKRIIKKKTRVCRHDREPSFNETFRFCMNPTGHSIQLFLVSNGGKFVKKTLIGEAYVWLDKVDLRKRVVSWHKLLATTAQIHS